jgi:signal transduction histidine kinase
MLSVGGVRVRPAHSWVGVSRARRGDLWQNRARTVGISTRSVSGHDLSEAVTILAALIATLAGIAFALHWDPHVLALGLRATIETTIAVAIFAACALVLVQFRRRRQIEAVLLLSALIAVGVINFVFWAPRIVTRGAHIQPGADASLVLEALVPMVFAMAAFAGGKARLRSTRAPLVLACSACLGIVAAAEAIDLIVGRAGPPAAGSGAALVVNTAGSGLFVLAAACLYRRSRPASAGNSLLAGAASLLAAARLHAVLLPVEPGTWVTPRELLRLGAYGLLLGAALVEYRQMRRADDRATLVAERERLVDDLHDGLVQDLAAVAMYAESLDAERGREDPITVGDAARHALAASRRTIVDLWASSAPNTITSLRSLANELEARFGVNIAVYDAADQEETAVDLSARAHERFIRAARDMIIDAAVDRHARHVDVVVRSCGTRWMLAVGDDGIGFEQSQPTWFRRLRPRPPVSDQAGDLRATKLRQSGGATLELPAPIRS